MAVSAPGPAKRSKLLYSCISCMGVQPVETTKGVPVYFYTNTHVRSQSIVKEKSISNDQSRYVRSTRGKYKVQLDLHPVVRHDVFFHEI